MTVKKRWLATLSGVLVVLVCAVGGTQAAQAYDSNVIHPDGTRVTETDGASAGDRAAAAWRPDITPLHTSNNEAVFRNQTTFWRNALLNGCKAGRACIAVGQGDGLHTVFVLYQCDTRTLTNFIDAGAINNNQSDDAVVVFTGPGAIGRHYPDGEVHGFNPLPYDRVDPC
ncbi:hypothetical protein [Promicromonospora sp. NPDC050880]|uniref:hypothetical protein n=1 Tax=Promicromonospora sp. NPDC050880 TaxID=3364406 RepID=UPI0037A0875A